MTATTPDMIPLMAQRAVRISEPDSRARPIQGKVFDWSQLPSIRIRACDPGGRQ